MKAIRREMEVIIRKIMGVIIRKIMGVINRKIMGVINRKIMGVIIRKIMREIMRMKKDNIKFKGNKEKNLIKITSHQKQQGLEILILALLLGLNLTNTMNLEPSMVALLLTGMILLLTLLKNTRKHSFIIIKCFILNKLSTVFTDKIFIQELNTQL